MRMMRSKQTHLIIIMPLLIIVIFSCDKKSKPIQLSDEQLKNLTLSCLAKVSEYPLYVMTYYGDYGFDAYLKTGQRDSLNISNPLIDVWGCTCFSGLDNENSRLFGRNFDWLSGSTPLLLFTDPPGGLASASMVDLSYFGYSRENLPDLSENRENLLDTPWMPFDGMNEKGVAIGMMAVPRAKSPYDPSKSTLGEIELIRLVLDYAENLDHAISLILKYNIRMDEPPIHYMIADSSGRSAIIEFYEGKMKIIPNTDPWQVSTNFILSEYDDPGQAGCWRFQRACSILEGIDGSVTNSSAMDILDKVSQANTIWSVIYNKSSGDISIATGSELSNTLHYNLYD